MAASRFRILLALAVALTGVLMWSCGGEDEGTGETPAATESTAPVEVQGVTNTEILIGTHAPMSQSSAAVFAASIEATKAYFEYVNSQGGVHGRKIKYLVGDDHYNPADAVEVIRTLVERDSVFAIAGSVGPSQHMAVYNYLEEHGIPDLWVGGGLLQFTEPLNKYRFQGTPDYSVEGKFIAKYLTENFGGKRLGLLAQNDEAGATLEEQLRKALEGSDVEIVATEKPELTATDLTANAQRLKNANPDVVALLANAGLTASFIKSARDVLAWDVSFISITTGAGEIVPALAGSKNVEGLVAGSAMKLATQTDDPDIQRHKEILEQFGTGQSVSTFTIYGQAIAELTVKALENAGPNLTPDSLAEGAEAIRDYCCTMCTVPVNLGPDDHRPFESLAPIRWQDGQWVQFGDVVSFESTPGEISSCEGEGATGS